MTAQSGVSPHATRSAVQPAVDFDTLIRSVLFIAVFLSAWVSFHPFQSLADPPQAVVEGGDTVNQLGFSTMFLALAAWTLCHQPQRVTLLLRPILLVTLLWCVVTILASWEPSLAARRFAFTLVIMSISGMVLLLPKDLRHFSDLLAATVVIVLGVSYLGVLLVPQLAVHQATDFLEPEHAGSWRGAFHHKNDAGATMVLFIFIGLFVARMRSQALGYAIVVLSGIFLAFTQSKTAIGVMPLVFVLGAVIVRSRGPIMGIAIVTAIVIAFNLFSVGTVVFEPLRRLVELVMPDATFTGRTEIWELGLQAIRQRPITGYGYLTFWGTPEVVYGFGDSVSWANAATDAHNAYVNLALSIGIPGMLMVVLWVVIMPIVDFYRGDKDEGTRALQLLFLRVCLYGIYASSFESSIFQQVGEVWFMYMTATFGLRYLSLTRAMT